MANFFAIPTLAGQAAIAAAMLPSAPPMALSRFVVGDGNGNYVAPIETQTQLVNQRADVAISAIARVNNTLKIDGILDETVGGFTIREAGILDTNGVLLFVAAVPPTQKTSTSEGTEQSITLGIDIVVSDTANITLVIEGTSYATHNYVNEVISANRSRITTPLRPYFLPVKSLVQAGPPDAPTPGDVYVVAADPTGSWAGQAGKLAQYITGGTWVFVAVPNGHLVGDEASGNFYQRIGNLWAIFLPKNAVSNKTLWLQDRDGVRSWSSPRDLTALDIAPLAPTTQIGTWNPTLGQDNKTTVIAISEAVALADYIHSEMFFMGNF